MKQTRHPDSVHALYPSPLQPHRSFEEYVSDVADRYGQQFRLLLLRSKENKIDEAFGYVRG